MTILYSLGELDFEWDPTKAESNEKKYGVTFKEAAEVFLDPLGVIGDASKEDETRFFVLGISLKTRLLLVIHIERGERTRIISARNATKAEQRLYQDEQF